MLVDGHIHKNDLQFFAKNATKFWISLTRLVMVLHLIWLSHRKSYFCVLYFIFIQNSGDVRFHNLQFFHEWCSLSCVIRIVWKFILNGITIHTVELFSYRIKDFSITHVRVFYYCKDDTGFEELQIQFLDVLQGFKISFINHWKIIQNIR